MRNGIGNMFNSRSSGFMWVLPVLIVELMLLGYPIIRTLYLSLFESNFASTTKSFIGFQGFVKVLLEPRFYTIIRTSLVWTVGIVVVCLLTALPLAALLNKGFGRHPLVRLILLLPWATPWVIIGLTWKWIYASTFGMLDIILRDLGLDFLICTWLIDTHTVLPAVMAPMIWRGVSFGAFMYLAALQGVPEELYEAATVDGANELHKFWHISIPGIAPTILVVNLLGFMWTLNSFQVIWIMTEGGPVVATTTLPIEIYKQAFRFYRFGEASVYAVILMFLLSIFVWLYLRFGVRFEEGGEQL